MLRFRSIAVGLGCPVRPRSSPAEVPSVPAIAATHPIAAAVALGDFLFAHVFNNSRPCASTPGERRRWLDGSEPGDKPRAIANT